MLAEEVTLTSDVDDLDKVRQHFHLESAALLGHSWGAVFALEYARQRDIMASAAYKEGDPEAVAARYRLHFKLALKRPEDYEKLMATMKAGFIRQGKEGIVEDRSAYRAGNSERSAGHAQKLRTLRLSRMSWRCSQRAQRLLSAQAGDSRRPH